MYNKEDRLKIYKLILKELERPTSNGNWYCLCVHRINENCTNPYTINSLNQLPELWNTKSKHKKDNLYSVYWTNPYDIEFRIKNIESIISDMEKPSIIQQFINLFKK